MRQFRTIIFLGLVGALMFIWLYRLAQFLFLPSLSSSGFLAVFSWLGVLGGVVLPGILILLSLLLMIFLVARAWRWAGLALAVLFLEGAALSLTSLPPYRNGDVEAKSDLQVAIYNMHADMGALVEFSALVHEMDLVFLAEAPARLNQDTLNSLFHNHRRHQVTYLPGYEGTLVMLVKGNPTVEIHEEGGASARPIFEVTLDIEGEKVRVLATHALAPFRPLMMVERNATLARLSELAAEEPDLATLILGDLNTTPFEPAAWRLPGRLVGNPLRPSWNGARNLLHMRLDHIRLRQGKDVRLRPQHQRVGPDLGSDHLPVFASFSLEIP